MSTRAGQSVVSDLRPRITVIGVGGAGCNAVNNMISAGLSGVEFIVANTDAQALLASTAARRLQLGTKLTEGLGAGSKPEIGRAAAEEAFEEIRSIIEGSHMVFVAAGMGGGTGTGAAAVIARCARELGILTVGVVTKPFLFEGARRMRIAEAGIAELKGEVDTLIVIPNQNLFRVANEKTTFEEAFVLADQVLYSGVACIVDLIVKGGIINLDFADVRTVMSGMGAAMLGTGEATGERRATRAAEDAIANPLLDDISLKGAKGLLLSITGSHNLTLFEVYEAANRVKEEIDPEANIIFGATLDETLGDRVRVSIVASGLNTAAAAEPRPVTAVPAPAKSSASVPAAATPPAASPFMVPAAAKESATPVPPSLSPPPLPAGVSSDGDDDLHRRLSEVLQQVTSGASSDGGSRAAEASFASPPAGEQWTAPGGVTIEAGPPPGHAAPLAKPSSLVPDFQSEPAAGSGFMPAPAIEIRRGGRRIPGIDEFPPVGQRDYHAKRPGPAVPPAPAAVAAPAPAPTRRPGLLERITGRVRGDTDSRLTDSDQSTANRTLDHSQTLPRQSDPITPSKGRADDRDRQHTHNQDVPELPVFFGGRRRS